METGCLEFAARQQRRAPTALVAAALERRARAEQRDRERRGQSGARVENPHGFVPFISAGAGVGGRLGQERRSHMARERQFLAVVARQSRIRRDRRAVGHDDRHGLVRAIDARLEVDVRAA